MNEPYLWETDMITDRTKNDIIRAKELRDTKIAKGESLTDEELEIIEKGFVTLNTINRIETKQEELKILINSMGYWNTNFGNQRWNWGDIFAQKDLDAIIQNNKILKNAFFAYSSTPETVKAIYDYKEFNKIEQILVDIEKIIGEIKGKYRKSGTFKSGEVMAND